MEKEIPKWKVRANSAYRLAADHLSELFSNEQLSDIDPAEYEHQQYDDWLAAAKQVIDNPIPYKDPPIQMLRDFAKLRGLVAKIEAQFYIL